jgi:CHAT domain
MRTLRLTETASGSQRRIDISLEDDGPPLTASADFAYAPGQQDEDEIRWYLEDYALSPADTVTAGLAGGVEKRVADLGAELFRGVFDTSDDARELWTRARSGLVSTRVEVVAGAEDTTAVPWELLRDPGTDTTVALRARSFVRSQPPGAEQQGQAASRGTTIRILFVICRPGVVDIPLRSVVNYLVRRTATTPNALELQVLRPPSFAELQRVLEDASHRGMPYDIVHFDGHGIYVDATDDDELAGVLNSKTPLRYKPLLSALRPGAHGYLLFEEPGTDMNLQIVDGPALGQLLAATDVPVLILNACRSAYKSDLRAHNLQRAYGSLAQEVMEAGLSGVVAMRYNIYVETAAQFIAQLYATLLQGEELGTAVTLGRKHLAAQPIRYIGRPVTLRDWNVPVIYETTPLTLVDKPAGPHNLVIVLPGQGVLTARRALDAGLPAQPDAGFVGRDETLLVLDRRLDSQPVVLLHGDGGIGRTATAAEFARWYVQTGGVTDAVLYTSFARHKALAQALDQLGQEFDLALQAQKIQWQTLDQATRRSVALQLLQQKQVLWIWDDVSAVADRPGVPSAWTLEEQEELAAFLRDVRDTKAKLILVSLREEQDWLADLPARIRLPAMEATECRQLAERIMIKQWSGDATYLHRLCAISGGNPEKLIDLLHHVVRERLTTKEQLEGYIARLETG